MLLGGTCTDSGDHVASFQPSAACVATLSRGTTNLVSGSTLVAQSSCYVSSEMSTEATGYTRPAGLITYVLDSAYPVKCLTNDEGPLQRASQVT